MKNIKTIWMCTVAVLALGSCTDDSKLDFDVEKPEAIAALEYLNNYDVLKSYVDRNANPKFKLGAGVDVASYNKQGLDYAFINSNFDDMTAGWEMKHGGVVQDNGSLNLANVEAFVGTARKAGLSIYGHTLCWHSNQNATYLNSTIAPIEIDNPDGGGGGNGGYAYQFTNPTAANFWSAQVAHDLSGILNNTEYTMKLMVKANTAGTIRAELQSSSDYSSNSFGTFPVTTEWTQIELTTTTTKDNRNRFLISFGDYVGTVMIDNVVLSVKGSTTNLIANSDFEINDAGWGGWGNNSTRGRTAEGEGYNEVKPGYSYTFTNPTLANFWSAQVAYGLTGVANNTEYVLKFVVKSTSAGTIRAEIQSSADYSSNGFGTFNIGPEWKEYELKTTTTKADRNRFIISFGDYVGTVFIDNVTLKAVGNPTSLITNSDFETGTDGWGGWGNNSTRALSALGEGYGSPATIIIEKTPEEKAEIIGDELERWISGMLAVTKGFVTAWDVVNEPMSDWPDPSQLKTGVGQTLAADEFYWQDYLGKDYAVMAFNLARQYGEATDILFINDYGLEGADQKKCLGLIDYVEYVEGKGAKIDGIGTQMHVTLGQTSMEGIRAMFTNLAATGKLIKVSELDMGYRREGASENVKTNELTNDERKAMANFYRDIVSAYFELVPAAQRYGITIWSPLDSPDDSSWRAGEPIGLWDRKYNRNHSFGGVANGLAGKDVSAEF